MEEKKNPNNLQKRALCTKKYRELTLLQLTYYPQPYFLLQHLGIPSGQMSKAPRSYHYWSESFFWSRKFSVCPSKSTSIHVTTYDENIEFEMISSSLFFLWYKMFIYHVFKGDLFLELFPLFLTVCQNNFRNKLPFFKPFLFPHFLRLSFAKNQILGSMSQIFCTYSSLAVATAHRGFK